VHGRESSVTLRGPPILKDELRIPTQRERKNWDQKEGSGEGGKGRTGQDHHLLSPFRSERRNKEIG